MKMKTDIENKHLSDNSYYNMTLSLNSIKSTLSDAAKSISSETNKALQNISTTTKQAITSVKAEVGKAGENVGTTTKQVVTSVGSEVKKDVVKTKALVNHVVDQLDQGVAVHYAQKVNPTMISVRGAFRSLLELNLFSITKALGVIKDNDKKKWDQILQKWWMLGGEKGEFDKLIDKKKNSSPAFQDFADKFNKKSGIDGYSNAAGTAQTVNIVTGSVAAIAGVVAILATLPDPVVSKAAAGYVAASAGVIAAFNPIIKSFIKDQGGDPNLIVNPAGTIIPQPTPEQIANGVQNEINQKKADETTTYIVAGGALLVVAIGGYLILK